MLKILNELILPLLENNTVGYGKSADASADFLICKSENISDELSIFVNHEVDLTLSGMIFEASKLDTECSNLFVLKKRVQKTFSKEAIFTWISGKKFYSNPSLNVFHRSLLECDFKGSKVVFTNDMDIEYRILLDSMDYVIIDVSPKYNFCLRDRHIVWYDFLNTHEFEFVYFLDVKDVLFQKCPCVNDKEKVYLVLEGKKHFECDWNTNEQIKLQGKVYLKEDFSNWEVICGGSIFGNANKIKNLFLQIWSVCSFGNASFTDQAALNYLYHCFCKNNSDFLIIDPRNSSLVATADLPNEPKPIFKNGLLFHSTQNEIYAIWHQWDRTEHSAQIIERYL
jgi:hypothetical protein